MHDAAPARAAGRPLSAPRRTPRRLRGRGEEDLVVAVVTQHAESVLRLARRVSICDADAQDAYQRGLEIFVKNAGRLDPEKAAAWLRTVVKHEALSVRAQRLAAVSRDGGDLDLHEAAQLVPPEDQVVGFDRLARSAEALRDLKPDEVRALWLRAEGYSYAEIGETFDWSHTKVNRLLAEGRARFLSRYATIESGGACAEWTPVLSAIVDRAAGSEARRAVGAHLRSCAGCRATLRELRSSRAPMQALLPVGGLVTAAGGADGDAPGRLVRLLEALFVSAQDRLAAAAVKVQLAADTISAGKVAAVTASAAALAGGGAVVAQHGAGPAPRAHHRVASSPAPVSLAPALAPSPAVGLAVPGPSVGTAAPPASVTGPAAPDRSPHATSPAARPEFSHGASAATSPAGEFAARASPSEFAAASGSPSTSSHTSAVPAAAASSSASSAGSSGASSAEFSREFP